MTEILPGVTTPDAIRLIASHLMGWEVTDEMEASRAAARGERGPVLRSDTGRGFRVATPGDVRRWDPMANDSDAVEILEAWRVHGIHAAVVAFEGGYSVALNGQPPIGSGMTFRSAIVVAAALWAQRLS